MQIMLTPAQFSALEEKLSVQQGVKVEPTSETAGTVTTSDVTLSYLYDGTASLDVEVTAKRSFKAKLASESMIEGKIREMFAEAQSES